MPYETIDYQRKGRIAYLTLNRPESHNAMSMQLQQELAAALEEFDFDDEAWVAIVHGAGRSFSAGADVKQRIVARTREERLRHMTMGMRSEGFLGRSVHYKPVIAAVHGHCLGMGLILALECDLIVATEDARFGIPETKRGITGGQIWARLQFFMSSKVATEALLTGEPLPAAECYRLGLINRLVPPGEHVGAAEELARKLLACPPLSVRSGVRSSRWPVVRMVAEQDLYVRSLRLHMTEDYEEAARAWAEKRDPEFHCR